MVRLPAFYIEFTSSLDDAKLSKRPSSYRASTRRRRLLGPDAEGYDSEAVRRDIEQRGGEAAIPSTATRKTQHAIDKALCIAQLH
jgi:hypothetical protein